MARSSQSQVAAFDEIILNALTHGQWAKGCVVVGQAFPGQDRIDVSILDLGVTIKGHLSGAYPEITCDEEAICKALEDTVTGTRGLNCLGEPNSGAGLHFVREFVESTSGELAIFSGDSLVCCCGGAPTAQPLIGHRFPGTLVNIRFNTNPGICGSSDGPDDRILSS